MSEAKSYYGEEANKYLAARGPEWAAVFGVLRDHVMGNMVSEDDPTCPFPLVDLMSNDGKSIESGEWEMIVLADDICAALAALAKSEART